MSRSALRIAVVANTAWYLHNFRRNLMRALQADGHHVVAIGGDDEFAASLRAEGIEHRTLAFSASGMQPWRELRTVLALRQVLARERIDLVLSYTPKGNIYSALALSGRPGTLVMNISGLGMAFARDGLLAATVRLLYRATLRRAHWVFFQNEEDLARFRTHGLVDAQRISRLPGSGVDLAAFQPADDEPPGVSTGAPLFLMVARLLWDKGVGEFVDAARQVKAHHPQVRFRLLGAMSPDHRGGVPNAKIDAWIGAGLVEAVGAVADVRPHLREAACVVLPSVYGEGVPRSLLEGASMARPLIATDSVGCRDAIDDGVNGFLCRPRDASDLTAKMLQFLALDNAARQRMGHAGRAKVEREFDEQIVIAAYRRCIATMRTSSPPPSVSER